MKNASLFLRKFYQNHRLYFVILSYFLLLDLLVFGMGLFLYQREAHGARQEMMKELLIEQDKHAGNIQEQYQGLYSLGQSLLNHFYIQRNLVPYEEATKEERIQMINIPSILSQAKDQWDAIDEIFLYMDSAKGYTQDGMESRQMYYDRLYIYEQYPYSVWQELLGEIFSVKALPPSLVTCTYQTGQRGYVLPIVSRDYVRGQRVILVVNVDLSYLTRELKNDCMNQGMGYVLQDASGSVLGEYEGHSDQMVYASPVTLSNGWTLSLGMNYEEYLAHEHSLLLLTGLLCGFIVLIGFLLSLRFSYMLYHPLHFLQNTLKRIPTEESGKRRFLPKGNPKDLQSLTEGYSKLMEEYTADMESAVMLYLLYGRSEQRPQDFERHFRRFYHFQGQRLQCFLIQLVFSEKFEEQKEIEKKKLMPAIRKLLEGLLSMQCAFCVTEHGEGGLLLFVENMNENGLDTFLSILKKDTSWFVPYIGASEAGTLSMVQAYDEARTGLEYGMIHQNAYQIQSGEHPLRTQIPYYPAEEASLLLNLQKGDLTQVKTTLEEILDLCLDPSYSWRSLRRLFERIYRDALRGSSFVETDSPVDLQNANVQQIIEVLMERFRIFLVAAGGPQNVDSRQITAVCDYVKEHYRENLSLTSLSEALGYSSKYLSRLFKETMSWNLSDYIQYVRIEKAKELLLQTQLSVEEIQDQVGIPSRTTFIRVFKKFEGLPPGQYRKLGALQSPHS